MIKRDLLQRQIEQLGQSLAKAMADIYRFKSDGKIEDEIGTIEQELGEKLNLDIPELIEIPDKEFIEILRKSSGFDDNNLELFADFLFVLAGNHKNETGKLYYSKSLAIYEYIEREEKIYSFDRRAKIREIKVLLSDSGGNV